MSGRRVVAGALAAGVVGLTAACGGSAAAKAPAHQAAEASSPAPVSMVTSTATSGATWVTLPMGAAAGPNQFWELFSRPAGSTRWALHTPPDVATNGALVLAAHGATLTAGIRPSIDPTFSPITATADAGKSWTTSAPQTGLAGHPDALAAAADGHLIADGQDNTVSVLAPHGVTWSTLTSKNALAAGTSCGLTAVTAVGYTPTGTPLVAGTCSDPGTVGIYARTGSGWRADAPTLPASLLGQPVQVVRLARTPTGDVAVLQAGPSLVAAWRGADGSWSRSSVLSTGSAGPQSVTFGKGNDLAVITAGGRAQTVTGPGAAWRTLPTLPTGRAVALALPAGGPAQALAATGGTLTVWQLAGSRWAQAQTIKVPIQYGSSSGS
ncbi:MAG TPA: hypothetical protein VGI21_11535 [Streptosporangiaceae bacterium]|jgi:hypothetical protein